MFPGGTGAVFFLQEFLSSTLGALQESFLERGLDLDDVLMVEWVETLAKYRACIWATWAEAGFWFLGRSISKQ